MSSQAPRSRPAPTWDGEPIRPTVATVDLSALAHNFRQLRAMARPAEVLAVVKADAYGHGAVPCSRVLAREGAAFLGVALIEEGIELRRAGLQTPILVLGGSYGTRYDLLVAENLTPLVFRPEHLVELAAAAREQGREAVAHLDLETGMGRIGVSPADLPAFLDAAVAEGVRIEGLSTHFANADLKDPALTRLQVQRFEEAGAILRTRGFTPRWLHLANSAATVSLPAAHGTLVRPGVMLYGARPSEQFETRADLRPVLRWTTAITHLKDVPAGTAISYGWHWTAARPSRVATIPVGYADGFDRRLTNVGEALLHGRRVKVAGTVCMDQLMLDVTDVPGAAMGDEVVLIGEQGPERVTADEMARVAGTINYDIFCGIGPRVPRRFLG
jgi:alanine racemase